MKYNVNIHYKITVSETRQNGSQTITESREKRIMHQSEVIAPSQEIASQVALFNLYGKENGNKPVILEITVTAQNEVLQVKAI